MTSEQVCILSHIIMALNEIKVLEKKLGLVGQQEIASQITINRAIIARSTLLFLDTLGMDYSVLENNNE